MTQKEHDEKVNDLRVSLVEAEKQIQDIREELDKLDKIEIEPESRRWKPKCGQRYYYITPDGRIFNDLWVGNRYDLLKFAIGNCFETKEEAEFEVERLKVIAELKEFAEPNDSPWDGCKSHYHIGCCGDTKHIEISGNLIYRLPTIYFESREKAEEAIKAVGEDRIKKYCLRVKKGE